MSRASASNDYRRHARGDAVGALLWLVFIATAVVAIATLISTAVLVRLQQIPSAALAPSLVSGHPSPAPPPLPKPGIAPTGA